MSSFGAKLGAVLLIFGAVFGAVLGVIVGATVAANRSTTTIIYRNGQSSAASPASVEREVVPVTNAVTTVKKAEPAVVWIEHQLPATVNGFGQETPGGTAIGSGFIIDKQGDIVTNDHVIAGGNPRYTVTFADGAHAPATLVGGNPTYDIAVIHVSVPVHALAQWGDSSTALPGEPVVAIGDPLGQFPDSVSEGIVSGLHRTLAGTCSSSASCPEDYIQTDAPINHGNSGGPLLDLSGHVIGITTAIQRSTGQTNNNDFFDPFQSSDPNSTVAEGLGFAIPSDTAAPLAEHMIHHTPLPFLGVCYRPVSLLQESQGVPQGAALVTGCHSKTAVEAGSPAAKAGLKTGDVIESVGSTRVTNNLTLIQAVLPNKAGQKVPMTVWRPKSRGSTTGRIEKVSITFGKS